MNNDLRLWKLSYQNNVSRLQARSEKASDTIYVEHVKTDPRTCAEMAKGHLHIADISVKKEELYDALTEANHWIAARSLRLPLYNARDIINLKITFSL